MERDKSLVICRSRVFLTLQRRIFSHLFNDDVIFSTGSRCLLVS